MSYLNQPDYVRYECNCGSLKPISKIYFCRHCCTLRCGYCVCQEVDLHYCPTCMENVPTAEARLKKHKCSNCFVCPCCFQTLSVRAGPAPMRVIPAEAEFAKDSKATVKKVYYLFCSLCRWCSRDAGIPDRSVATGDWPEQENPHLSRINSLIEYHKIRASIEKQQREKKKFPQKRSFMQIAMYNLSSAMVRKRLTNSHNPPVQPQSTIQPTPSLASEDVEELPEDIFTAPVDMTTITTLEQRLQQPESQPEHVNHLRPQHRQFLVKRSQRCRVCEHNVTKSDICSQSTKFKIQLAAFYHIPEVRIVSCEPLRIGKTSELLLKFCNPTQHQTQITLFPLGTSMSSVIQVAPEKEEVKEENIQQGCESPNLMPSIVRQVPIVEEPKTVKITPNADIVLPHSPLILPPRDDAAEYDDTGDNHNFQDDPKLVVWRKGNRAVVRLHVTPNEDMQGSDDKSVIVGFVMQYGYVNTITALEHKPHQKLYLKVKLYLSIGDLVSDT